MSYVLTRNLYTLNNPNRNKSETFMQIDTNDILKACRLALGLALGSKCHMPTPIAWL